ncbi:hypothetical protein D9Q98_002802 [Chlorella vulgaris]|uniref:Fe2OG dioxygenase domain-containing protein n=1 Tax=Chlorella vulgaris TaxID=3077 RepID=A0A9D4TU59_CHLVU|nr:hypothetical protein D9Q98_002802 [Chlorella vulgaris]
MGTSLLPDLTRGGLHLTLRITDDRTITWTLSLTDLARDGGGSTGKPRFESRPFAMPPACLPAACQHLLAHHRWCLVWQAAGAGGGAVSGRTRRRSSASLSLSVKWLGGPEYPGTAGTSVCCELMLAGRWLEGPPDASQTPQNAAAGSRGTATSTGAAAATAAAGGGRSQLRQLAGARRWLRRAFNARQPVAGLPPLRVAGGGGQQGGSGRRVVLEASLRFEGVAVHVEAPLPGLVVHEAPLVLKVSEQPCLLLVDDFLSPSECQAVRCLGGPHLKRSMVSAGDETPLRTSSGAFLTGSLAQHPVAAHLDLRVSQLAALACQVEGRRPLQLGEATQVVRYDPGQFYALHLDNRAGDCAKRAATVMVYLSAPEEGGHTFFPRSNGFPLQQALDGVAAGWRNEPAAPADEAAPAARRGGGSGGDGGGGGVGGSDCHLRGGGRGRRQQAAQQQAMAREEEGLRVAPREGRAVLFWSRLPSGAEDQSSLHEACRVERGTKWIATRWCREEEEGAP